MKVSEEDIAYARREMENPVRMIFGDRDWERALSVSSPEYRMVLDGYIWYSPDGQNVELGVNRAIRRLMTFVFGAVYHGGNKRLPCIKKSDFMANFRAYADEGDPQASFETLKLNLQIQLEKLNPVMAKTFILLLGCESLPEKDKVFVCVSVLTLARRRLDTMPTAIISRKQNSELPAASTMPDEFHIDELEDELLQMSAPKEIPSKPVAEDTREEEKRRNFTPNNPKYTQRDREFLKKAGIVPPEKW